MSFCDDWMLGAIDEWDAQEAILAARHILNAFDNNYIRTIAGEIDTVVREAREILESHSQEEIISRIEQGMQKLHSALGGQTGETGVEEVPLENKQVFRTTLEITFGPPIQHFQSCRDDQYNLWNLALGMNGGLTPHSLHGLAPNILYAVLALYSVSRGDVLSAYKFLVIERSDLQMHLVELEPYTETGIRTQASLELGREASAKIRTEKSHKNQKQWREMAIEMWPNKPGYTVNDMAVWIKNKTNSDAAIGTIKKALKGVKSSMFKNRDEEIEDEQRAN